jgi:hypothetical protein
MRDNSKVRTFVSANVNMYDIDLGNGHPQGCRVISAAARLC